MSHVLVVDDDMHMLRTNLSAHGYPALTPAGGTSTLRIAAATPHPAA